MCADAFAWLLHAFRRKSNRISFQNRAWNDIAYMCVDLYNSYYFFHAFPTAWVTCPQWFVSQSFLFVCASTSPRVTARMEESPGEVFGPPVGHQEVVTQCQCQDVPRCSGCLRKFGNRGGLVMHQRTLAGKLVTRWADVWWRWEGHSFRLREARQTGSQTGTVNWWPGRRASLSYE